MVRTIWERNALRQDDLLFAAQRPINSKFLIGFPIARHISAPHCAWLLQFARHVSLPSTIAATEYVTERT